MRYDDYAPLPPHSTGPVWAEVRSGLEAVSNIQQYLRGKGKFVIICYAMHRSSKTRDEHNVRNSIVTGCHKFSKYRHDNVTCCHGNCHGFC